MMNLDFKIGMIAPSRAGKTTLMTAVFHEMKNKLSGNPRGIQYWADGKATQNAISRALAEFSTCTATDDIFEVPQIKSTESTSDYRFAITVPTEAGTQRINIDIMDYPGGLLGTPDFSERVGGHLNESAALVVPIPSDILMEWKRTFKVNNTQSKKINIAASTMLEVDTVTAVIADWLTRKADKKDSAVLVFVPLKCEGYFNDNGGTRNESVSLHDAVKELYLSRLELTDSIREHIQIEIHAVDTYGIVELRDIALTSTADGSESLVSTFRKRLNQGNKIKSRGAFEILATVIDFRLACFAKTLNLQKNVLTSKIQARSWYEDIWVFIVGDPLKKQLVDHMRTYDTSYGAMSVIAGMISSYPDRQVKINTVGKTE